MNFEVFHSHAEAQKRYDELSSGIAVEIITSQHDGIWTIKWR